MTPFSLESARPERRPKVDWDVLTDTEALQALRGGYSVDFTDGMIGDRFFSVSNPDSLIVDIPDAKGSRVPCVSMIQMHLLGALGDQTTQIVHAVRLADDRSRLNGTSYYLKDTYGKAQRYKLPDGGIVPLRQDGLRIDSLVDFSNFLLGSVKNKADRLPRLGNERISALANFCLAAADVWHVVPRDNA